MSHHHGRRRVQLLCYGFTTQTFARELPERRSPAVFVHDIVAVGARCGVV